MSTGYKFEEKKHNSSFLWHADHLKSPDQQEQVSDRLAENTKITTRCKFEVKTRSSALCESAAG